MEPKGVWDWGQKTYRNQTKNFDEAKEAANKELVGTNLKLLMKCWQRPNETADKELVGTS